MKTIKAYLITALGGLLTLSACGLQRTTPHRSQLPKPHKWQLVWEDDFERADIFATNNWRKIGRGTADWNNTMSSHPSLYDIRDGILILRGTANTFAPEDSVQYLTGGISTQGLRSFDQGRIEVRCRLQAAQGAWPAIWMLPQEGQWPYGGEIDIMERLNHDSFVYQTIHSNYTVKLGRKESPKHFTTAPIKPSDYNVYAIEILPEELRFFVNNRFTFSYPRIAKDADLGQFPFGKGFYLLIDMQLGGKWVGEVSGLNSPIEMHIDWVRYYQP